MACKEMTVEELARSLGANINEIREKQILISMIVRLERERSCLSLLLLKS
jgi:hypothetical protein